MYLNNQIEMFAPIAKIMLNRCHELSKTSTCNTYKVGSVLMLHNGREYYGSSGNKIDSCIKKGDNYCARDKSVETLEYLTCPSFCAEGEAILKANVENQNLKGAALFTTGFPCKRCKDLIIHFGIDTLVFSSYKNGHPRLHEDLYASQMISRGIGIYELNGKNGDSALINTTILQIPDSLLEENKILSGEFWLKMLFDIDYKSALLKNLLEIKDKAARK